MVETFGTSTSESANKLFGTNNAYYKVQMNSQPSDIKRYTGSRVIRDLKEDI